MRNKQATLNKKRTYRCPSYRSLALNLPSVGGQIEGDTETLLSGSQVLAVELVGFLYCTESGILFEMEK
jgi:hypothetical protein